MSLDHQLDDSTSWFTAYIFASHSTPGQFRVLLRWFRIFF
jgi:hypothetical protein